MVDVPAAAPGGVQGKSLRKIAELEAITRTAKRGPAFLDDVTAKQMGLTGEDFIKNETPLGLAEYPAVVVSMNRHKDGLADEVIRRAYLIYNPNRARGRQRPSPRGPRTSASAKSPANSPATFPRGVIQNGAKRPSRRRCRDRR